MKFAASKYITASLLLFAAALVEANYLNAPVVQWTYQIPGAGTLSGRGLRRHNSVTPSLGGSSVFATADDGSLHIIKPENLDTSVVVDPPAEEGAYTECRSGVSVSETNGNVNFVVYAVILTPVITSQDAANQDLSPNEVKSRVIAVHEDGSVRWSIEVAGYVEGTPVVGITGSDVYLSHNVPTPEGGYEGRVSVIHDNGGNAAAVAAELTPDNRSEPFGPLTVRSTLSSGVDRDVVFWGESSADGNAAEGFIYTLLPSESYAENKGVGNDSYTLRTFGTWERSLVTRPTVSQDLSGLWVGGGSSVVAGWIGNLGPASNFDSSAPVSAVWETDLETSEMDPSKPLPTALIVSSDNNSIYMTDAAFNILCIDSETGNILWFNDGNRRSGYLVEPKLSEIGGEQPVVYTIEARQGNVRQHDARDGSINWDSNCNDRTNVGGCQDSVEAEFSISSSGNLLYFADIFGKITALQVATFATLAPTTPAPTTQTPTSSPVTFSPVTFSPLTFVPVLPLTLAPSVLSVSIAPTTSPTSVVQPTPTQNSGSNPTGEDSLPTSGNQANSAVDNPGSSPDKNQILVYALIAIFAGCGVVAIVFFALFMRKRKKSKEQVDEVRKEIKSKKQWKEQQRQFEEECGRKELEMLTEIGAAPSMAKTPLKRSSSKKFNDPLDRTPTTLASIEEFPNEDLSMSLHSVEVTEDLDSVSVVSGYDSKSSVSSLASSSLLGGKRESKDERIAKMTAEEKRDAEGDSSSFLPKALASSFDQVTNPAVGFLGSGGNNASASRQASRSQSPARGGVSNTDLDAHYGSDGDMLPDRPWMAYVDVNGDAYGDDESSIGSNSLFIDEDGSLRAPPSSQPYWDGASEPGQISTKANPKKPREAEPKEAENDTWSNMMSTLITAEKNFFNPSLGRPKAPPSLEKAKVSPSLGTPQTPTPQNPTRQRSDLPFDEMPFDEAPPGAIL